MRELEKSSEREHSPSVLAVISNIERLLADAELLIARGSAGSALSLAILAFEEAGKGMVLQLDLKQPGQIRSKHEFRHAVAMIVLTSSIMQKYGLDGSQVSAKIQQRHKTSKPKKGRIDLPPMPDELRAELRELLISQFRNLSTEEFKSLGVEMRWVGKIGDLVHTGGLEKLRQSGLYVDTDRASNVLSTPFSVDKGEASRWIWAATRVLRLLKDGDYKQSYTPLSELLAAVAEGDENAKRTLENLTSGKSRPIG